MNDRDEIMHILKRLEYVEKKIEVLADGICAKCMSRDEDYEDEIDSDGYRRYKNLCSECPLADLAEVSYVE